MAEHPAKQGDMYISPSDPQTGSRDEVEHEQAALQEEYGEDGDDNNDDDDWLET